VLSCGQCWATRRHIFSLPGALHSVRICSIDSIFWQGWHICRCPQFGTCFQCFPTFGSLATKVAAIRNRHPYISPKP
jgi:hypothetical protein